MFKTLIGASALAVSIAAMPANAAVVTFEISGFSPSFFDPDAIRAFNEFNGTGQIRTTGSDGTYTLDSGLVAFSLTGVQTAQETIDPFYDFSGDYAFGLADLRALSVTLEDGLVTALTFRTERNRVRLRDRDDNARVFDRLAVTANLARDRARFTSERYGQNDVDLAITGVAVPEPATWAMMIGGIGAAGGALRRRTRTRVASAA